MTTRVTVKSVDLKSRKAVMDCVCMADGKELMRAEAEVMVRKRRKKKDA